MKNIFFYLYKKLIPHVEIIFFLTTKKLYLFLFFNEYRFVYNCSVGWIKFEKI